jgi:hypothetical protein
MYLWKISNTDFLDTFQLFYYFMMFVSLFVYVLIIHRNVSYTDVKLQSYVHVFLCSVMMCRQRS